MNRAEEACKNLIGIFSDIPEIFEQNREMVNQCDKETQDLLHEIELSENQTAADGYKLYKALREVRRKRRQLKDENEAMYPLVDAIKFNENFRLKLYRVHSQIKEILRQQSERVYKPRVRDDLTICDTTDNDTLSKDESA